MKKVVVNIFLVTLMTSFLLIILYPQDTREEIQSEETILPDIETPKITIYIPSEEDYMKQIKQLTERYDLSLTSSKQAAYYDNLLGDIEIQLNEIAQKNATIYASLEFNKFKKEHDEIRGVYFNGYLFNNPNKRESIEEILMSTNVNTLVIDVKTDNGHILFDTDVEEVSYINNERVKFSKNEIQDLREIKDLYLIARLVVFQDPLFAKFFPDEAVFDSILNKPYLQNGQFFLTHLVKKFKIIL